MPRLLDLKTSAPTAQSNSADASGIYTWVIRADTVYSDSAVAKAFGFTAAETLAGLPLKRYLARIHPDDLPRVAKAIRDTMISGGPYQEDYRVCRPDGSIVELTAFGTCFRDSSNEPSHYAGIVFPSGTGASPDTGILHHLLTAHDLARQAGRPDLADRIGDVITELDTDAEHRIGRKRAGHLR